MDLEKERLVERIKELEKENKALNNVLMFGEISTITTLIEQFQSNSKSYLRKIVRQYQYAMGSEEERKELNDFILYLGFIIAELKKLLPELPDGEKL